MKKLTIIKELPCTGRKIGDVYFLISEIGYGRWERYYNGFIDTISIDEALKFPDYFEITIA